jgi:hypothetical protein
MIWGALWESCLHSDFLKLLDRFLVMYLLEPCLARLLIEALIKKTAAATLLAIPAIVVLARIQCPLVCWTPIILVACRNHFVGACPRSTTRGCTLNSHR